MKKVIVAYIAMLVIVIGVSASIVSAEAYEVEKGDNLWNIAQEFNTTVEELVELNQLKTTVIQPKQIIIINETYTVEKGDTLISLSNKFDVALEDIKVWNDLDSDLIIVDQKLKIKELHKKEEKGQMKEITSKKKTTSVSKSTSTEKNEKSNSPDGKTLTVSATAYTAECEGCSGITYTGVNLNNDRSAKVIAVDPNVIPLGSRVYVEGYGYATAEDIGGAIKGNRIDIHVPTKDQAYAWGVRTVEVTILN